MRDSARRVRTPSRDASPPIAPRRSVPLPQGRLDSPVWPVRSAPGRGPGGMASLRTISRAGPSSSSPRALTPPPTTIISGSNELVRFTRPTPSQWASSSTASRAALSPTTASRVTAPPVKRPCSWSDVSSPLGSLAGSPARAAAYRTSALPEAYTSKQPREPQGQGRPPARTMVWPSSPAPPPAPR